MKRSILAIVIIGLAPIARADQFTSVEGKALDRAIKAGEGKVVEKLSASDIGALPNILQDARAPLLAARTAGGNLARLIAAPELRKAEGGGPPIAVIVLERFDTYDAADLSARVAGGRGVVLFPGFEFDLDTGQVVPPGQGGDLACLADGPSLAPKAGASLYTLAKLPAPEPGRPPEPTPGRVVVPGDFAGRYRLFANGQWAGTLDLVVTGREVSGQFRSDSQGSSYPVGGTVDAEARNKVNLVVRFPRAEGEFEGYLWTEGKGALAGTFRLLDRTFGFFATREGGRYAPETSEAADLGGKGIVVEVAGESIKLDGKMYSLADLTAALKSRPEVSRVEVRVPAEASFSTVERTMRAIESAGVGSIRLVSSPR